VSTAAWESGKTVSVKVGSQRASGSDGDRSAHSAASSSAKSACMAAVNRNYGGRVENLRVVRSEFSQASSEVIFEADGERWRCLSSNSGEVQDLSVHQ